ncbi:hypothetical protein FN846DRAFT_889275 [Sphaerosporella brunnea]|uniref:Mid2 domain-containing protein n=1 Tax=Sphaerosporella brunnea TaxID=1250544 RepID=A0A5J5F145_9PEZI|nr:hypothetical protein FN846DRAFT_889275 [Sphaerosporella brunnea]
MYSALVFGLLALSVLSVGAALDAPQIAERHLALQVKRQIVSNTVIISTVLDTVTRSAEPTVVVSTRTANPVTVTAGSSSSDSANSPGTTLTNAPAPTLTSDSVISNPSPEVSTTNSRTNKISTSSTRPTPTCPADFFECGTQLGGKDSLHPILKYRLADNSCTTPGGCCRNGWGCASSVCIPPITVTETSTCMPSSTMCPASVGGGCCPNGYICGATVCSPPPTTIPPTIITGVDITITQSGSTVTATTIITKGSELPIDVKITPTASSTSTTFAPVSTQTGNSPSKVPQGTVIGAVVGGVVIVALIIGGIFIWTRYKVSKRGNTEASYQGRHHRGDEFYAAPTMNAYDPNAPPLRPQDTRRFNGFRRQPQQGPGQFNFFHARPKPPPITTAAPVEAKPAYPQKEQDYVGYAPVPLDSSPVEKEAQPPRVVELGDTSVDNRAQRNLHEVEGDKPRRWSGGIGRHFKKGSGGGGSDGGSSAGGAPHF